MTDFCIFISRLSDFYIVVPRLTNFCMFMLWLSDFVLHLTEFCIFVLSESYVFVSWLTAIADNHINEVCKKIGEVLTSDAASQRRIRFLVALSNLLYLDVSIVNYLTLVVKSPDVIITISFMSL